jgi:antitoxin component YwqK of YwqJK toxin-antitoxin module
MEKIENLIIILCSIFLFGSCKIQVVTLKSEEGVLMAKYQQHKKSKERNGYYRLYHENGKLAMEMFYKNGKLHGEERSYHQNGQLQNTSSTIMGSYEGPFKYWHATGVLHQEGNYINNNIEGNLKTYYPNGVLKEIVFLVRALKMVHISCITKTVKSEKRGILSMDLYLTEL